MEKELLKGNFKVKNLVQEKKQTKRIKKDISKERHQQVLNSLGGSMVYIENQAYTWEGDE